MLTSQAPRPEHRLAASDGDDTIAGRDSTAILQVESDRPSAEDVTVPPNAAGGTGSELQIRLDGPASVPPPASRGVARLEDVLTIGTKPGGNADAADAPTASVELPIWVGSRASVPPPEPREVARLEDVLSVLPDESARITPKTAAASSQPGARAEVEAVAEVQTAAELAPAAEAEVAPAATAAPAPVEEVQPPSTPTRQADDRRYVPAYALRAAFWFEQASAFESGSDDDEDEDLPVAAVAPQVEPVQTPVDVVSGQVAAEVDDAVLVETPRKHWMLALCLLAVAGLAIVLTGRRPCRCACKGGH